MSEDEEDEPVPAKKSGNEKKRTVSSDEEEFEEKPKGKKKKGKGKKVVKDKVLRAKVAVWADIPNWGNRENCPLLELPGEVLDRCFGVAQDLGVSQLTVLVGPLRALS